MTNLERLMRDLQTSIGEQQKNKKRRKPRKSSRADGTNPRAKGTNPRAKLLSTTEITTKTVLVEDFDDQDWEALMSPEERWGYDYE